MLESNEVSVKKESAEHKKILNLYSDSQSLKNGLWVEASIQTESTTKTDIATQTEDESKFHDFILSTSKS